MVQDTQEMIRQQRIEKVNKLAAIDGKRYPNDIRISDTIGDVVAKWGDLDGSALEAKQIRCSLAGRAMAINTFGKAAFLRVKDFTGMIQFYVRQDTVDLDSFERLRLTDIGDIVFGEGILFRTKTNELTLKVHKYRVLSKTLRPLPEKWHGLKDPEIRQRLRYLDLIMNEETRRIFRIRTEIIRYIRRFFDERGFLEVETPMMHTVLGGANAKPFITHHNALNLDLYLRIAPELFLKRLVVGGFDRVYEINRNFRNEGISTRHNPEFTMIEFYLAYATYEDLITLTEELLSGMCKKILGSTKLVYCGHEIDFSPPFRRISVCDALKEYCHADEEILRDFRKAVEFGLRNDVPKEEIELAVKKHDTNTLGGSRDAALEIGMLVFEKKVEDHLINPTFVVDYPLVVSPLSRKKDSDPALVDRFELYIAGGEVANAFSELNDPQDQEERFKRQIAAKALGYGEAMEYDEDYIRALEYGMPPTAGEGIGIDRLTMIFTNQDCIRDVILFPLLRPEK